MCDNGGGGGEVLILWLMPCCLKEIEKEKENYYVAQLTIKFLIKMNIEQKIYRKGLEYQSNYLFSLTFWSDRW